MSCEEVLFGAKLISIVEDCLWVEFPFPYHVVKCMYVAEVLLLPLPVGGGGEEGGVGELHGGLWGMLPFSSLSVEVCGGSGGMGFGGAPPVSWVEVLGRNIGIVAIIELSQSLMCDVCMCFQGSGSLIWGSRG